MTAPPIAVLMACHNRRELTLRCLASLADQPLFDPANLFLVDDGSIDGTAEAVRDMHPAANLIAGDGNLFWNGGMRRAWEAAKAAGEFDFYLWLNDDVVVAPGTLAALVADADSAAPRGGAVIVAAATSEPGDPARITYGGHRRSDPARRFRLELVAPVGQPAPLDSISGNIVLVAAAAERVLGNLTPRLTHIYGDIDYGFRARAAGIPMVLASRIGGTCAANSVTGSSLDPNLPRSARLRRRWREDRSLHARDWRRFVALHGGPLAVFKHWVGPYLRIMAGSRREGSAHVPG
ncbi:MAG: glycosyltransferase family 2 protein [Novosphingobium sp.]